MSDRTGGWVDPRIPQSYWQNTKEETLYLAGGLLGKQGAYAALMAS